MTHTKTSLLCAAVLVGLAFSAGAQQTQLTPSRDRITDEAIHADLTGYEHTQGRIQALNDGGRPIRDYHLSKALRSLREYSWKDTSSQHCAFDRW